MQAICGLQVLFLLFNCQTSVMECCERIWKEIKQSREQKHRRILSVNAEEDIFPLTKRLASVILYNPIFDS